MLAQLDEIEGVDKSFVNHEGTLIRISLARDANRATVVEQARKLVTRNERSPVQLTGKRLRQVLQDEQWRESNRVSELSAIEFRTLVARRLEAFAEAEKLDPSRTERLLEIAEQEWQRLLRLTTEESDRMEKDGDVRTGNARVRSFDWSAWRAQFADTLAERAENSLSGEQLERLKQALAEPDTR